MPNEIRALAFDIDGTLTNDAKVVTPRTREAVMRAQEAGLTVILASGRPAHGLKALAHELELDRHHGLLVSFNGGRVIDAATDEVLFDAPMAAGDVSAILHHMKGFDVIPMVTHGAELLVNDVYDCMIDFKGEPFNIIKYESRACDLLVREVRDLERVCTGPENKVLTAGTPAYLQEHWREMAAPFSDHLSCVFTAPFYFEFTAQGTSKGAALAGALPKRGIDPSTQLAAFGDAENDLSMIRLAALGVAMGNATDEVKAAADRITADNDHDGIADVVDDILR